MDMVYLKLVVGIVITRTLLMPVTRGSYVVAAAIAVVLLRARSASGTTVVLPTTAAVFAPFFPRLERKRLAL